MHLDQGEGKMGWTVLGIVREIYISQPYNLGTSLLILMLH